MLLFMRFNIGITGDAHHALFGGEVYSGILNKLADNLFSRFFPPTSLDGLIQFVDHIDQFFMLVIDFLDANA